MKPADGLRRLQAIREMRPRHGRVVAVVSYVAMTVGICLVLEPTPGDLAVSAILGLLVGVFVLVVRERQALAALVPVIAAMMVSALSFVALKHGAADAGLRALIAPLITFLPGGALTTATLELASGQMVAGASRLVFGSVQLLLLAFGIVAGAELVGLPSQAVTHAAPANLLGPWAPWLGVIVFGVAVATHLSAPRGALPWLMLVLLVAWTGQVLGELVFGAGISGFFGALAMTPVALLIARLPGGPPAQVTFLPAFWLLVPGALGLIGVTELLGNPATASLASLVEPIGAIISIALGVLGGVELYRGLAATPRWLRRGARWRSSSDSGDAGARARFDAPDGRG